MRSKAKTAEVEQLQTKIRMVMEAHGQPMTVAKIREHPTMADVSGHKIAQTMRHMTGVRFGKGKKWTISGTRTKVKVKPKVKKKYGPYPKKKKMREETTTELDIPNARFRISKEGRLFLSINGASFQVEVE